MKVIVRNEIESMSDTLTPSWDVYILQGLVKESLVKEFF